MIPLLSERLEGHWFFKYKVYHFVFWAAYHLILGATEFSLEDMVYMIMYTPRWVLYLFYVIIHTLAVFMTLYVLVPHLLEKGKLFKFIASLCVWIIITSIAIMGSIFLASYLTGKGLDYFCAFETGTRFADLVQGLTTQILPHTTGAMLVGLSIKLVKNKSETQQREQELEKEKLETELKFLRNQFNPHFLFNTINSIFFLIHKDPTRASTALGKFSELLRYQLYDCNERQIPLSSEIEYLKNFVALERLRKTPDLQVSINIEDIYMAHLGIAPFILMTFVENAFKHVSKHKIDNNWIAITLNVDTDHTLQFEVANSKMCVNTYSEDIVQYGGIGLKNVQRRLTLLYPGKHTLDIRDEDNVFSIQLQLSLSELQETEERVLARKVLASM